MSRRYSVCPVTDSVMFPQFPQGLHCQILREQDRLRTVPRFVSRGRLPEGGRQQEHLRGSHPRVQRQTLKLLLSQICRGQLRDDVLMGIFRCWCLSVNCEYIFCFEVGQSTFTCPLCVKTYCLDCRSQFHTGLTCKEYSKSREVPEEDEKFYEFAQGARYKQCPRCQYWVEKS